MSLSPNFSTNDSEHHDAQGMVDTPTMFLFRPFRHIRPLLRHLLPLIICLICIPVLLFFSGAAGWIVWRNVPVGWKLNVNLQYGDAVNPFANFQLPPVLAHQPYDISLHLVVPATETNFALGNFMASLQLTSYNESIAAVRRSTTLVPPHTSFLKQLLLGAPSTSKVDIFLLSEFVSGTSTVTGWLELGRADGWKGVGNGQVRELSVLEATLNGVVRPKGVHIILARYPRFTTFMSTFIFFFISLIIVSVILLTATRLDSTPGSLRSHGNGGSSKYGGDNPSGRQDEPKPRSRYHSPGRRSDSGFSSPDDEIKPSENSLRLSGIRKRTSGLYMGTLDETERRKQIKVETDNNSSRHHIASPF